MAKDAAGNFSIAVKKITIRQPGGQGDGRLRLGGRVGVGIRVEHGGRAVLGAELEGLDLGAVHAVGVGEPQLVDGQSRRSPVKVIAFTTPDSTVPAFAQGYPYMSLVTDTMAQVTVMPTKSCKL